ncbi:Mannosyl-oligosaccharide 1-2-alpha-mannosidase [Apiospora rasikravindrae]|uniref:alpha-1,2-Mannosidase n=1 Tax=Apiospora rasikravindrae TaxID=990691 RepID=A0ABR1UCT6_9PEZI
MIRDPFNIHRNPASGLAIIRNTATRAATDLGEKAVEASINAIEKGKQAVDDMAFSIPKNVPSFSNPQRQLEDRVWGNGGRSSNFLNPDRNALPMYKDKPYAYPPSQRSRPLWRRKRVIGIFFLVVVFLYHFGGFSKHHDTFTSRPSWSWLKKTESGANVNWMERREHVVDAFKVSWDSYHRYAWGHDEFHPITKKGRQMVPHGMGWIIVDALDTMILMNLTSRVTQAREWIFKDLSYDQDHDVNTFETTIRMLGGLLSAHYLSNEYPQLAAQKDDDPGAPGEDLYLEKAKDLADRLISAFDSPSGIPYASVNLAKYEGLISHADGGASSTAETTTLQLEFKYLAKLTGEKYFWDKAEKVMKVVDDNGVEGGLVPIYIYAEDGKFRGRTFVWAQEPIYLEMWDEALQGVRKHLVTYTEPSGYTIIGERPEGLAKPLSPKMDHLVCFMPGTIALGATGGLTEAEAKKLPTWTKKNEDDMRLARELMQTCWGMYKWMETGLAAEITYFNIADPPLPDNDVHNLQRPETVESLFYMWRITGERKYREWGWEMFKSFMNYTALDDEGGFTSLSNANTIPPVTKDNMESFWLAETLKYFYLLFSPSDLLPLDSVVINTEAHAFPRFQMAPLFSTGWERKPRGKDGKIIEHVH